MEGKDINSNISGSADLIKKKPSVKSNQQSSGVSSGTQLVNIGIQKVRGALQRFRSTPMQPATEINAAANSYITPEMEDKAILEQLAKIDEVEREAARVQEEVTQSTLPSLDQFPPVFNEALLKAQDEFRIMRTQLKDELGHGKFTRPPENFGIEYSIDNREATVFYGEHASDPKEYYLAELGQARQLYQLIEKYASGNTYILNLWKEFLKDRTNIAKRILHEEKEHMQITSELREGGHYLTHGVGLKNIDGIFESGSLRSHQAQLDRAGKVYVSTFGQGVTGNAIEYPDRYELLDQSGRSYKVIKKDDPRLNYMALKSNRERYEIFLLGDGFYYGGNSVGFIFPAGEILQDASWYVGDGIHIFDKNFDSTANKIGAEISLTRPHFVIAPSNQKERVLEAVRKADWITDKAQYIKDNIVFADFAIRGREYSEPTRQLARQKFQGKKYSDLGAHIIQRDATVEIPSYTSQPERVKLYTRV